MKTCFFLVFPSFKVKSVTFIFAVFITLVYFIVGIAYLAMKPKMSYGCILYYAGAKFTYAITRQGQLHRLILPMILHSGFFHLFWNVLSLLQIGFAIENAVGTWYKYCLLLIVGAIGGIIFSATISPYNIGVGSSTSLFAILACLCTWYYLNFKELGP